MSETRRTRRRLLAASVAGGIALLAGCSDPDTDNGGDGNGDDGDDGDDADRGGGY